MHLLRKRLWLVWIVANTLGGIAGVMLASRIYAWQQEWAGTDSVSLMLGGCLFFGGSGAVVWLILGTAQSLGFLLMLPVFGVRPAILWPLLSVVAGIVAVLAGAVCTFLGGGLLGLVLIFLFGSPPLPPISLGFSLFISAGLGAVGGLVVATCQLPLLGPHIASSAKRWVGTNMIAWATGMTVAYLFSVIQTGSISVVADVAIPRETVTSILSATLTIVVASLITGAYLAHALKTPAASISPANDGPLHA